MKLLQRLLRFLFGPGTPPRVGVPPPSSGEPWAGSRPAPAEAPGLPQAEALETMVVDASAAIDTAPELPEPAADPYFSSTPTSSESEPAVKTARPKGSLGLEAGAYLPITREEIKDAARGTNLMANAWFGRRDLIPPADDPRTQLIDRAMVTQGLISPEQLRDIHEIGDRMDRLKPTIAVVEHRAQMAGQAAVEADREARARLKALKKAEAAERRRQRVQAIAQRRETDIVFLGRGVSGRLGDRKSDLEALARLGLPPLSTPAELAGALGLPVPRLRWLAFHAEAATRIHYVQFTTPKKSGGTRTLSAPHRTLAGAQRWIFDEIVGKLPVEEPAHGFVAGRSIVTNAAPHARRAIVVNLDLEGFFPSIGFPRVRQVFQGFGYSPAVATVLALLCTECPRRTVVYDGTTYHVATGPRGLPQGACTSPGLSNQVARRLDRRLGGLARVLKVTYTRYADDLTFSGGPELEGRIGYLMARVRHFAGEEGFAVNEAKTRVLRQKTAQIVTGLVVNDRPGVRRDEIRRLRAILHRARSEGLERQNRKGHPHFLAWLQGKIAFVAMSRPEAAARLRADLAALLERERERGE